MFLRGDSCQVKSHVGMSFQSEVQLLRFSLRQNDVLSEGGSYKGSSR